MFMDYLYILITLFFAIFLALLIYFLSFLLIPRTIDLQKISIYECGFEPFEHIKNVFEVKFYLVAILFVIFDLEVMFLFPWILTFKINGFLGTFSIVIFLFILGIIYIYEWLLGALDW
jgi:NADH-quinone oxidoreductase subunit A